MPSVRFNDFAFALHAVILSSIVYSQFWPRIWGFKVSRFQTVSRPILGLFWGSLAAVAVVVGIVLVKSPDGGYDPSTWAWIDVVSAITYVQENIETDQLHSSMPSRTSKSLSPS